LLSVSKPQDWIKKLTNKGAENGEKETKVERAKIPPQFGGTPYTDPRGSPNS
jgi:hypothetical protein